MNLHALISRGGRAARDAPRPLTRWLAMLAVLAALLIGTAALAQSRGLDVTLKVGEAPGAPDAETVRLYSASYALVIGIDAYTSGWPRLSNAVKDAELVADALRQGGFEVALHRNLKSDELARVFREFFVLKGREFDARLLVWFAGHGHTVNGEGFLLPADAPPERDPRFQLQAVAVRDFNTYVRQARSKHAFVVFDSCFAGTVFDTQREAPPPAITRATALQVRQFLTSGDAGQRVSDDGTFRELFLRVLRGEERAMAGSDSYLTASALGLYLSDRVTNLTQGRQTPRYGKLRDKDWDRGDFVLSRLGPPGASLAAPAPPAPSFDPRQADITFWQSIQNSTNAADFEDYLREFPRGQFRSLAERRRDALRAQQQAVVPPTVRPSSPPAQVQPAVGIHPQPQQFRPAQSFKDCAECPEMVAVPAGSFTMGSPTNEMMRARNEDPQRQVTISRPFAVGKFEITFAEWEACVAGGGCGGYRPPDAGWGRGNRPVINVSWYDAQQYVEWLSGRSGKTYRLLSEAEWEYAARAGTTTPFHTGAEITLEQANFDGYGKDANGKQYGGHRRTVEVGQYPANAFGLHDMHGNVQEWVEDCSHSNYEGAPSDGSARVTRLCPNRMLRGGDWSSVSWTVRSAARYGSSGALGRGWSAGFRVARTLN